MTHLVWNDARGPLEAWSDQLLVGAVVKRPDGQWWFDATYAVNMHARGVAKGSGLVSSLEEAKAAVEQSWAIWLRFAGLIPAHHLRQRIENVQSGADLMVEYEGSDGAQVASNAYQAVLDMIDEIVGEVDD